MEKIKEMYAVIFKEQWPFWAGGIFLAIDGKRLVSPLLDTKSIMALGLVFGSFTAALISGEFGFRMPPWFELLKGGVAGTLMGFSSVLAGG